MKTKTIGFTLAFCFLAGGVCFAVDPHMGTWKLNEAKSKITPGTPKFMTVTFQSVGGSIRVIGEGIDAKGKPMHVQWSGNFDGKDYPTTGDPAADTRSYKKVDDRTLEVTAKKKGQVTVTARSVVSADGKSRTATVSGTTETAAPAGRAWQRGDFLPQPKGKKFKNIAVYDKQ
jgi:hypothetical protein